MNYHTFRRRLTPTHLLLLAILALALGLRLFHLGTPDFWVDELGQAISGQKLFARILVRVSNHHGAAPLDYLITAAVVRVSTSPAILRLPAALWGTLAVFWAFRLGRRLYSPRAGLMAALLLATSVLHIRYSQELRFYSLFTFLSLVVTEALWRAWGAPERKNWLIYGGLAVLLLYSHYYGVLVLGFHAGWAAVRWWEERGAARDSFRRFFVAGAGAVIAFVPWVLYDLPKEEGLAIFGPPTLNWALFTDVLTEFSGRNADWWPLWLLFFVVGLASLAGKSRAGGALMALWSLASLPIIVLADQLGSYFFHIRQMLFVLPIFLLLAAIGIERIAHTGADWVPSGMRRRLRAAVAVVFTALLIIPSLSQIGQYFGEQNQDRNEDWRNAATFLAYMAGEGDIVVAPAVEGAPVFYRPDLENSLEWARTPAAMQGLFDLEQPMWVFVTPYLGSATDAAAMRGWLDQWPALIFELREGFQIRYLQANRDQHGLWGQIRGRELPQNAVLLAAQGYALRTVAPEEAVQAFERAADLTRSPEKQVEYLLVAGDVAGGENDYGRALSLFERALDIQPDQTEALVKKGFAHLQLEEPDAARAALMRASELGQDDYWLQRWLGMAYSRLDRPAEAIPHFLRALEFSPDAHDLRYHVGVQYAQTGDDAQAEVWLRAYLEHDPQGPWATDARQRLKIED